MSDKINVEVAYALPDKQKLIDFKVPKGTNAIEAVKLSGVVQFFPDISLEDAHLGIFSQHIEHDQVLKEGDRVEIYRPLLADPKEVRKRRAAEMAAKRTQQKQANKRYKQKGSTIF